MSRLENGDVIRVKRGLYAHYGVYVDTPDGGHVIHYTGTEGHSDFKGVVRETSLNEFLDGDDEFSVCRFDPEDYPHVYSGTETVRRARARIGERRYNLLGHNCEHFAVECKTGRSESSQTQILDADSVVKGILSEAEELFSF